MVAECHGRVLCLRAFASCLGGRAAAGGSVTCTTGLTMRSSDAPNTPRPSMFVGGVIALVADTTLATVLRNLHVTPPSWWPRCSAPLPTARSGRWTAAATGAPAGPGPDPPLGAPRRDGADLRDGAAAAGRRGAHERRSLSHAPEPVSRRAGQSGTKRSARPSIARADEQAERFETIDILPAVNDGDS